MAEPHNWAQALGARHMARTVLIKASARFHYRVLVLSHTLSQALRPPTWEHVLMTQKPTTNEYPLVPCRLCARSA